MSNKVIKDANGNPLPPFQFSVIEDQWHNGYRYEKEGYKNVGYAALKNGEGNMCCLGFACRAMGVKNERLIDAGTPDDIRGITLKSKPGRYFLNKEGQDNHIVEKIISVNDDRSLSLKQIKSKLKRLFAKLNIDINFVPTKQQLPAIVAYRKCLKENGKNR